MPVDFANDLILITGASGRQGGAVLSLLAPRCKRLRLQCASAASAQKLQEQHPEAEIVQSEFRELADARKLMQGVTTCFLVIPAFHSREAQCGLNMIDAAIEEVQNSRSFQHMVFSSVLHPIFTPMTHHDNKRIVEEALLVSGLNATIVQPSHMMDNLPIHMIAKAETPTHGVPFSAETKFSFTAIHDHAEAVTNIIAEREQHYHATYEIVSTRQTLNYVEVLQIVSEELGRKVEMSSVSSKQIADTWVAIRNVKMEADKKALHSEILRMFTFYDDYGLRGNANVLRMLIGREPLSYREWVKMQLNKT